VVARQTFKADTEVDHRIQFIGDVTFVDNITVTFKKRADFYSPRNPDMPSDKHPRLELGDGVRLIFEGDVHFDGNPTSSDTGRVSPEDGDQWSNIEFRGTTSALRT
jgi:hypothetical protein